MDDVVDFDEVLLRGLADVLGCRQRVLEAVEVDAGQVGVRASEGDEFGHGLRDAGTMGDPDRLGDEEPVDLPRLAHERSAVGGEGEDAVEAALDLCLRELRQQLLAGLPFADEVLRSEVEARGHDLLRDLLGRVGPQSVEVDGHRAVSIGADADPLAPLAEVEVFVLVAQDRSLSPGRQLVLPHEGRHLGRPRELVAQGQQGNRRADHLTDLRAPESGAGDDDVGRNPILTGDDGADPAAGRFDVGNRRPVTEFDSCGSGAVNDELGALRGQSESVAGGEQPSEDHVPVEHGEELRALICVDGMGFDAVGPVPTGPSVQILQPLFGRGDLESADGQERAATVGAGERREFLDRVLRELGHRLRGVRGEDESRRVRGRSAGNHQRALLDDERIGPAQLREFVGEIGADDAGSDDDDSW